jgi:hypothetical protein
MASTYSNLKIQLMATGENAATWGNVTNVNMGTALEEAITGSASIAFSSADQTLTLTDTNSSQSARHMRLNLTGTATAGYNLIVPSIQKPYIINNGTDGTITVKNATGTGIAVPTGKTMWVYNNATNVVDVVTHLTSLTLATALPVLSGGTGSNTSSGARTNLGLGTISTQNSNAVTITGGSITGITDLAIADGGTGASDAPTARTNLGATTVGGNVFTLTNPSAITFPRFNADNTVSALDAATFRTAIGAGTGNGSVTSVAMSVPSFLSVTGSPITGSGTLAVTLSGTALAVTNGGTGGTSASAGATGLGLGTASNVQHSSLGIGTAASGTTGEIRATNNVTAFYSSDATLKENIQPIQNALGIVSAVGGKTFDWTDAYIAEHGGEDGYFVTKSDFGVIAQDVQAVFPLAVRKRPDGTLAVDYEKLVAVAFAAIDQLKAEVDELRQQAVKVIK